MAAEPPRWIARTRGSERSAACLRRFEGLDGRQKAINWLMEREAAPYVPARRRVSA